eukprot:1022717-Pelagomonas_calceolata.AAC.1
MGLWDDTRHRGEAGGPHHNEDLVLKLKHFSNLNDALRTHMHSKRRLGKANTNTGYYSSYQSLFPSP